MRDLHNTSKSRNNSSYNSYLSAQICIKQTLSIQLYYIVKQIYIRDNK